MQSPIPGGHPFAMLHLALHCELGIGIERNYPQALKWYKSVLSHPDPGEESISPVFAALSRLYRNGLGVEKSEELANKYAAFSQSNPETAAELQHLEQWWESGGREACQRRIRESSGTSVQRFFNVINNHLHGKSCIGTHYALIALANT